MKIKINNSVIVFAAFALVFFGLFSIHKYKIEYHRKIKLNRAVYVFDSVSIIPRKVLLLKDIKYKDEFVENHLSYSRGETVFLDYFKILCLPENTRVYLLGYTEDSLMAKVACYRDLGRGGGNFNIGYVLAKNIYEKPVKP